MRKIFCALIAFSLIALCAFTLSTPGAAIAAETSLTALQVIAGIDQITAFYPQTALEVQHTTKIAALQSQALENTTAGIKDALATSTQKMEVREVLKFPVATSAVFFGQISVTGRAMAIIRI